MTWSADVPVRILGEGKSGQAARDLALAKGCEVQLFDEVKGNTPFLETLKKSSRPTLWIVSPGFDVHHPWLIQLRASDASVVPELEFGASFLQGEVIVITGSLGKTSMVLFAADLLRRAGYTVTVSGNIGTPVSQTALENPEADFHLIEASSFQLETLQDFQPKRACCLNLYPNHLDRHGTMQTYAEAKAVLFRHMEPEGMAVWPEDYPVTVTTQATRKHPEPGILPELKGTLFEDGPLRRNLAMTFSVLQDIPGLSSRLIEETARDFEFPAHRLEVIAVPGMGLVIDDSKSTCFQATKAALEHCSGKAHVIMGGLDKDQDPAVLVNIFAERNPYVYLFGSSGKKMQKAWQDSVDVCVFEDSLETLMELLFKFRTDMAEPVLFSPGCASFDQFDGFASRGKTFQHYFRQMAETHSISKNFNPGTL